MADNQKLQETLKSLIYAGVGFASKSSERVQKSVEDLVKKGKINEREGKKIVDHVVTNADEKRKELEVKLNKVVDKYGKAGINQIQSLTKKIEKLESQLAKHTKPATKASAVAAKSPAKVSAKKKAPAKRKEATKSKKA